VAAGARSRVSDCSGEAEDGDCELSTPTDTSPQSEKSGQISRYRAEAVRCRKEGEGDAAAAARFARRAPIPSPAVPEVTANDSEATRQTATSQRAISRPRLLRFARSARIDSCRLKSSRGSRAGMHFSIPTRCARPRQLCTIRTRAAGGPAAPLFCKKGLSCAAMCSLSGSALLRPPLRAHLASSASHDYGPSPCRAERRRISWVGLRYSGAWPPKPGMVRHCASA